MRKEQKARLYKDVWFEKYELKILREKEWTDGREVDEGMGRCKRSRRRNGQMKEKQTKEWTDATEVDEGMIGPEYFLEYVCLIMITSQG